MDNKARELTNTKDQQIKEEYIEKVISQINLTGLTEQQQEFVSQRCRKFGYVEDLLNRGWIKRSSSNYSSIKTVAVLVFAVSIDNLIPR